VSRAGAKAVAVLYPISNIVIVEFSGDNHAALQVAINPA
jgi:hypothetical protein